MRRLVIDLEMAAAKSVNSIRLSEVIEIGAVLLGEDYEILQEFSTYVKNEYGTITEMISELTHITEDKTVNAPTLNDALEFMDRALSLNNYTDVELYTWSESDTVELEKEFELKQIKNDGLLQACKNFIDVQEEFADKLNLSKRYNLSEALNILGMNFEGRQHGVLADSKNTARILKMLRSPNKKYIEQIENIKGIINNDSSSMTVSIGSLIDFSKLSY